MLIDSLVSSDVLKSMCLITLSYQVRLWFFIIANDDSKTNARFTLLINKLFLFHKLSTLTPKSD